MNELKFNADGTAIMTEDMERRLAEITEEAKAATEELLEIAQLREGDIFVVGCSTSEVTGNLIGHASVLPVARAVFDGIYPILKDKGIYLAAQCCEHLNRALIIERDCAEKYGFEPVCVVPQPKAGGSFATVTYSTLNDAVAVESIKAHAGIDIGGTLIGMHLKAVAVPVRLKTEKIGDARILCARTRPKFIGGARAKYE